MGTVIAILMYIGILIISIMIMYYIIKFAVKNGTIAAYNEITSKKEDNIAKEK